MMIMRRQQRVVRVDDRKQVKIIYLHVKFYMYTYLNFLQCYFKIMFFFSCTWPIGRATSQKEKDQGYKGKSLTGPPKE